MYKIGIAPLWILFCLFSLSQTSETALSAALPDIARSFCISGGEVQKCSSIYFLGFSLGILLLGRASDIYGRRPVILLGLSLYCISTTLSIFAANIYMLMSCRFIQAFGASVGSVVGQAMARDSYQGKKLTAVYANLAIALAFIPSLGSTIGGYIVEYNGWKYIFIFLTLISFILLSLYINYLPETNAYRASASNNSYLKVIKIAIKDKILLLYALIVGSFSAIGFGFYMEAPFIFINKIGLSPSLYGKLSLLLCIANAFGSLLCKYLLKKEVKTYKIMFTGLLLSLIGCTIFLLVNFIDLNSFQNNLAIILILLPIMLHMIGHSLLIPFCLRYAIEDYSKVSGTAGSIFGALYYFLIAVISWLISKIHGDNLIKFTILFFCISICCNLSFIYIRKLINHKIKIEFY